MYKDTSHSEIDFHLFLSEAVPRIHWTIVLDLLIEFVFQQSLGVKTFITLCI